MKRIPEQAAASRSSSQRSWLRGSPMQPRPAGAPSAAVPGRRERPGRAGPASRRRPPSPTGPALLQPPRRLPAQQLSSCPGSPHPRGGALAGPGGGRVAPSPTRSRSRSRPSGAVLVPRHLGCGHLREPGFGPGVVPPRSRAGARGPGGWRAGRGAGRRRHLPGGPRTAGSRPAPAASGRLTRGKPRRGRSPSEGPSGPVGPALAPGPRPEVREKGRAGEDGGADPGSAVEGTGRQGSHRRRMGGRPGPPGPSVTLHSVSKPGPAWSSRQQRDGLKGPAGPLVSPDGASPGRAGQLCTRPSPRSRRALHGRERQVGPYIRGQTVSRGFAFQSLGEPPAPSCLELQG